jgi:predicted nucleotidyltransferase
VHPSLAFQEAKRERRRQELEQELARILPILKAHGVQLVILFGSAARGKPRMTSDLDLLVIMETSKRFLDRLDALYRLLEPQIAMDLLVYTPDEFSSLRETNPLVRQAIAEGRVLFAAESEG